MFAPVTNRGEAIGVLELALPDAPDEQTLADVALAAHALAYVVIANRRFTDLFEWGQRSVPLSLAAEIQRRLLPASYTCEAGQFTLAGWLEPAGDVGGDTFDFTPGPRHAAPVDDRRDGPRRRRRAAGHAAASAHCATRAGAASTSASRPAAQRRPAEQRRRAAAS